MLFSPNVYYMFLRQKKKKILRKITFLEEPFIFTKHLFFLLKEHGWKISSKL